MIYFITVSVVLSFYAIFAWYYFRYAFYFLLFYIPFQIALNPPIDGIDIATGRIMILILLLILMAKEMLRGFSFFVLSTFYHNCVKMWTFSKSDLMGRLLLMFLLWSGLSIFWSENWTWGLRKWLVFASIFPLYWITLYVLRNRDRCLNQIPPIFPTSRIIVKLITISGFFVALAAIIQFVSQFIWGGHEVFYFWGRNFFPIFLGQKFGETVFWYQSWFVEISGITLMRAVGFFPDPHTLGFYVGLIFPIALSIFLSVRVFSNWRKHGRPYGVYSLVYSLTIFLLFCTVFLTFVRSAYLGLAASLFTFFILGWKFLESRQKIFFGFLSFLTILFFLVPKTPVAERFSSSFNTKEISNIERLSNFDEALLIIKQHPLKGVGIGSYSWNIGLSRRQAVDYRTPIYAHNIYLDIWAEMGIIGLLLWLIIFSVIFYRGFLTLFYADCENKLSRIFLAGLLSALVWFSAQGFFDTPIFSPTVLPVLIIILALSVLFLKQADNRIIR